MKSRNKALANILLGGGAYLLDSMRERYSDNLDDLRERARDTYDVASDRASRATAVLRGDDSNWAGSAAALLLGVGVGVGIGILMAPASGVETRRNISDKVQDFGEKVRSRAREAVPTAATGTYGE
jgi:hypothetical protein